MSQSPSSTTADQHEASDLSDPTMADSLLFLESLKDLKNIQSNLYSAAEYFELSYINDNQKHIVIGTLKEYTVKALANTVDHLGSVSYKVRDLLTEEVDEVSVAELRLSCIEQKLRTCQEHVDKEGRSQQSLTIKAPNYHKHYMLRYEEMALKSDAQPASQYRVVDQDKEEVWAASSGQPSLIRSSKSSSLYPPPSQKTRSLSPIRKVYSPPPSPKHKMVYSKEGRTTSPLRYAIPTTHARSSITRSATFNSSKQYSLDLKDSRQLHLATERNNQKDSNRNPIKTRGFLKSLLTRQKSTADELLYRYLDEY